MSLPHSFLSGKGVVLGTGGFPYPFSAHTFTSAGATGKYGPSLSSVQSNYAAQGQPFANSTALLNVVGGIQIWKVPASGLYRFILEGGYGGWDTVAGRSAVVSGDVLLEEGNVLKILVGQSGIPFGKDGGAAGGGGGTFVTLNDNTPLFVAGGGGGADGGPSGGDASLTPNGGVDGDMTVAAATGGAGGGHVVHASYGGGGAGLIGNGAAGLRHDGVGQSAAESFINGGVGGGVTDPALIGSSWHEGGFGGGGGSAGGSEGGGGGGGYSGGVGGDGTGAPIDSGGGGSYVIAAASNVSIALRAAVLGETAAPVDSPAAGYVTVQLL